MNGGVFEQEAAVPGVSIYIITYLNSEERGRMLRDVCLNALEQDYPRFEVVVSDNAGCIAAADVLESIADPRLSIFRNRENLGMARNMNLCLERCRYDLIKINCDDDLLHPSSLRLSVPHVDNETLVLTGLAKFNIGSPPEELAMPVLDDPDVEIRQPGYGSGNGLWRFSYDGLPGCTLFSRRLFADLGCYDPSSRVEDWDFLIRARLFKKVAFVDRVLCYQGMQGGGLTEKMLAKEPYFFPQAGLHTKFKVLRDDALDFSNRFNLSCMISREFMLETLRLLKNFHKREYRMGYMGYAKELFSKLFKR
ncbi:MAG: glycosyltransferase [Deltaproteobacteria bacterium]|nr:glycosyltransferase [Deltaproteobacteria bacterium]